MAENTYKSFAFRDGYTPEEGVTVFYNVEKTLSKIKNDCLTGVGSSVTLTAPANKFVSTISVADANAQADAWLEANAQAYANNTGVCPIPFISSWKTDNISSGSSLANQVKLPLVASGTYDMVVEWGDGTVSTITAWNQLAVTHTYAVPGTYTIRINGTCTGWQFDNDGDKLKILNITKFGPLKLGNLGGYFYGCSNLSLASMTDTLNLTGTTSLANAFRDCASLNNAAPNMQFWDVSNVTDMSYMFSGATNFNKDVGVAWNTSNVENMSYMFYGAEKFDKDLSHWVTSSVKYMKGMFKEAIAFNHDVGGSDNVHIWDTSNVEDMSEMFMGAVKFDKYLEYWKTGSVTDMSNMFNGATAYDRRLPYNATEGYWDTSAVTNMRGMFKDAVEFSRDIDDWNVSHVTNMSDMFNGATSFNSDISLWNVGEVTTMRGMFSGATLFNRDISLWNVGKVTNMREMFKNATAFNQIVVSWDVSKVTTMREMFNGATIFHGDLRPWNISNVSDFTDFMASKTTYPGLELFYNSWSSRDVQSGVRISFGSATYTSVGSAGRAILVAKGWIITDGGVV